MSAQLMAWRSWESVWPMHWCKAYIDREPKLGRSNTQAGEKAYSKFWLPKWFAGNIRDHFYSEFWLELIILQSVNSIAAAPWIAACQASLSITNSRSLLKLMSIESVMPSSHLILCHPLLFLTQSLPASGSFPMSQLFTWGDQSIGVSALASDLPMNTQEWSPLDGLVGSPCSPRDSQESSSNTTVQKHQISYKIFLFRLI